MTIGHGTQFFERRAGIGREHGAAQQTERYIRAEVGADLRHLIHAQARFKNLIQRQHNGRTVGGAARQARLRRDLFLDRDRKRCGCNAGLVEKRPCRLAHDIAVIRRHIGISGAGYGDPLALARQSLNGDGVIERDRLHHHRDVVIAVGALADDIERQVDFCRRFNRYFHLSIPSKTL